jgi:glycosyltransferase involved in cell wall biosynthesis
MKENFGTNTDMNNALLCFSIIVPTFNRESFIKRTIESVLNQSYPNFEVIIVDDGSTDNTEAVVADIADERVRYFKKRNEERAVARNFGVKKARYSYITFLDSDDLLKDNHLEVACKIVNQLGEPPIFHLGHDVIDGGGNILKKWKPLPDPVNDKLIEGNFLSVMGVFIKKEILLDHPFNENRQISGAGEDYELWLRLAARYSIRTFPVSTSYVVNHDLRGVLTASAESLLTRNELLKKCWQDDTAVAKRFGKKMNVLYSFLELYVALHLAMSKHRRLAVKELLVAIQEHPAVMLNYRFWVVIKKLILN